MNLAAISWFFLMFLGHYRRVQYHRCQDVTHTNQDTLLVQPQGYLQGEFWSFSIPLRSWKLSGRLGLYRGVFRMTLGGVTAILQRISMFRLFCLCNIF